MQGYTTPEGDPCGYVAAITSLHAWLARHQQSPPPSSTPRPPIPLIVNTQGWVQGLGAELLLSVLNTVQPTHLLRVSGSPEATRRRRGCSVAVSNVGRWVLPDPTGRLSSTCQ